MSTSIPKVGENYGAETMPAWKQELNERLAATRLRRLRIQGEQVPLPGMEQVEDKAPSRAARLAAKVAKRYANAPSYSDVLSNKARPRVETAPADLPPTSIAPEASTGCGDRRRNTGGRPCGG